MFFPDIEINYVTVAIAAVAYYILGAIWYSPKLFGSHCCTAESCNVEGKKCACKMTAYIGEFIVAFVTAFVLYVMIHFTHAVGAAETIRLAFWIWLGFIATTHLSAVLWGKKRFCCYLVHAGFVLVGFIVMATIYAFLK